MASVEIDKKLWSDDFEDDLKGLRKTIKAHTWAHDKRQADLRYWGIVYSVIITSLGLLSAAGIKIVKSYAPNWVMLYAETMGVAVGIASGMRMYFNPDDMRAKHIIAAGAKGGIADTIKLQLNIPRAERSWRADDFYQYIFDKFGTVDSASPYLSATLLSQYPKNGESDAEILDLLQQIKEKHLNTTNEKKKIE